MPSVASEVVSACMGGMFSASALYPLEILKTRMQAEGDAGECQSSWAIFAVFVVAGASAPPVVSKKYYQTPKMEKSVERTDQRFGHRFMGLVKYSFMCTILMIPTWHFRGDGSGNGCGALE
eukprot:scaffold15816_cov70-Cyclotella_meneghiniana.AAC.13